MLTTTLQSRWLSPSTDKEIEVPRHSMAGMAKLKVKLQAPRHLTLELSYIGCLSTHFSSALGSSLHPLRSIWRHCTFYFWTSVWPSGGGGPHTEPLSQWGKDVTFPSLWSWDWLDISTLGQETCTFSQPTEHRDSNPYTLTNTYASLLSPGWPRNSQLTVLLAASSLKAQGPSHPSEAEDKLDHWKDRTADPHLCWKCAWKDPQLQPNWSVLCSFLFTKKKEKKNSVSLISPPWDCPHCSPYSIPLPFPYLRNSTCSGVSPLGRLP